MPRRSSSRPVPRPAAAGPTPKLVPQPVRHAASPPQPAHHAPPATIAQPNGGGSMLGGIGSTIAQGMAFGTGSAVAHRAVDAVVGPRVVEHEHTTVESAPASSSVASLSSANSGGLDSCSYQSKALQDCIMGNGSDISKCQFYLDMLNECRKGSSMTL